MKARVSQLHKTEAGWNKLSGFVPAEGEFIIFDPDVRYKYARLKIGDGVTKLADLPFFIDSAIDQYTTKRRLNEIIDAGRITDYKN
jgi:hypothetical protein